MKRRWGVDALRRSGQRSDYFLIHVRLPFTVYRLLFTVYCLLIRLFTIYHLRFTDDNRTR